MNGSATYFNCLERGIRAVQTATTLGALQPGSIMLNGQLG